MKNILFIVGTGRCGSKLIRSMLNLHPEIKLCRMAWFLPELLAQFGSKDISFEQYYNVISEHYGSNGERWIETIARVSGKDPNRIKNDYLLSCDGKNKGNVKFFTEKYYEYLYGKNIPIMGDNTPHNGHIIRKIKNIWPDAKVIHLVRNGYSVAKSMTQHPGFIRWINSGLHPSDLCRSHYKKKIMEYGSDEPQINNALDFWDKSINDIFDQTSTLKKNDLIEIKYEDLLQRPLKTLRIIFNFLNIKTNSIYSYKGVLLPRPFYLKINQNFKNELNYQKYESIIKPTLLKFGYSGNSHYYNNNYISEIFRSGIYYMSKIFLNIKGFGGSN